MVNVAIMNKMLAALNECTEWGQIAILTSLAEYKPLDSKEAENICERVVPRLQHANGSVVLSAIRVIMMYMRYIKSEEFIKGLIKKMSPPLGKLYSLRTCIASPRLVLMSFILLSYSYSSRICPRGPVRLTQEHQPHPPEAPRHSAERGPSLFLQIQRPTIRQA